MLTKLIECSKNGNNLLDIYESSIASLPQDNTGEFKFTQLKEVANEYQENLKNEKLELVGVVTAPDRYNRAKLISNKVALLAKDNDISTFQPIKLSASFEEMVKEFGDFDLGITASFGQIITQKAMNFATFGFINWHPSKLPDYRGATPMQTLLKNGEEKTALSWIKMTKEVDAGHILFQIEQPISIDGDLNILTKNMVKLGEDSLGIAIISHFIEEKFNLSLSIPQDHTKATFTKMIKKEDKLINLKDFNPISLYNYFRAYSQFPGVSFVDDNYFKSLVRIDSLSLLSIEEAGVTLDNNFKTFVTNSENVIIFQNDIWLQTSINRQKMTFIKLQNEIIRVNKITLENGKSINFEGFTF